MKSGPPAPVMLVVDKPAGITSHDVVAVLRAVTGVRKTGHTGTLDPFATGVLPVAFGAATRFISFLHEDRKVYDGELLLGQATRTGDLEGEVCETGVVPPLDRARVEAAMAGLTGALKQVPPAYSAIKVGGKPLYAYAREGIAVDVPARDVRVDRWELLALKPASIVFRVHCGRGTYVRALGEELAAALGTVGHLIALRRARSGPFSLKQSIDWDGLAECVTGVPDSAAAFPRDRDAERLPRRSRDEVREALKPHLIGLSDMFSELPRLPLTGEALERLLVGGDVPGRDEDGVYLATHGESGHVLALAQSTTGRGRPLRVVAPEARFAQWP